MQGFDPNFLTGSKSYSQHLFYGVLRNLSRIDHVLGSLVPRPPRPLLAALLRVAGFEMLSTGSDPQRIPLITDHATGQARKKLSPGESRLVNAVLRRFSREWRETVSRLDLKKTEDLSLHFSHPEWLVRKWVAFRGLENTRKLLEWNQELPEFWAALRPGVMPAADALLKTVNDCRFLQLRKEEDWDNVAPLLASGQAYIQDPATTLAPVAAGVEADQSVLDLCSAPGGKAWQLWGCAPELLVCIDRGPRGAGLRHRQWRENLERLGAGVRRLDGDLLEEDWEARLAHEVGRTRFDRVLIDVPCSNTGVIRRRPEVRWHLTQEGIHQQASTQRALLSVAAERVAPGGRLVYSTCSQEPEENQAVADAFSEENSGIFYFRGGHQAFPPEAGHDGAGVYAWERGLGSGSARA